MGCLIAVGKAALTRFHLVLEGVPAVDQDLVQVLRLIRQTEVHDILDLVGLVEVQDLGLAIICLPNKVQQNLQNFFEEI